MAPIWANTVPPDETVRYQDVYIFSDEIRVTYKHYLVVQTAYSTFTLFLL